LAVLSRQAWRCDHYIPPISPPRRGVRRERATHLIARHGSTSRSLAIVKVRLAALQCNPKSRERGCCRGEQSARPFQNHATNFSRNLISNGLLRTVPLCCHSTSKKRPKPSTAGTICQATAPCTSSTLRPFSLVSIDIWSVNSKLLQAF
jgi:hypothetical protein